MKIRENKIIRDLLYWLVSYAIMFLIVLSQSDINRALSISSLIILPAPIPVYLHFFIFDRLFKNRKYIEYIALLGLIIVSTGLLTEWIFRLIYVNPNSHISGLFVSIFFIVITSAFRYYKSNLNNQYKIQEIEFKQLQTEMSLLKSQINPHFFFNTLNNLYSLSLKKSDQVPRVILKLSELMRYVIDSQKSKSVLIKDEIRFLESYITLESLRLSDPSVIRFKKDIKSDNIHIAPMLLIPFVENAFKHGLSAMVKEGFIEIDLTIVKNTLLFKVKNSVENNLQKSVHSIGSGLINVKRRLEILYPNAYELDINETADTYHVKLNIKL